MEADVACKCGQGYIVKENQLVCPECGLIAPFQPVPSKAELVRQLNECRKQLKECQQQLVKAERDRQKWIEMCASG